jgi:hypothetical protein
LVALGVSVTAVAARSGFRWIQYTSEYFTVDFARGTMSVEVRDFRLIPFGWSSTDPEWESGTWDWKLSDYRESGEVRFERDLGVVAWGSSFPFFGVRSWYISLWPIAMISLGSGAGLLWWSASANRRKRRGLCAKCAYELAGLPASSPCPECGTARVMKVNA